LTRFSVVIATLGRAATLGSALESLAACDPRPAEVIVVDGAVEDEVRELVDRLAQTGMRGRYVTSERGSTTQRNAGLAEATGDVVVFADDDVVFDPTVFAELARAYGDPDVVGATMNVEEPAAHRYGARDSRVRYWLSGRADGTFTRYGYPRYLPAGSPEQDVELMVGCLMSARLEQARRVGFDEALPALAGYALAEDEDFSWRLSRLGRIRYLPQTGVVHRKQGFGSRDPRAFNRLVAVNRSYLFRKNFPQTRLARAQFRLFLFVLLGHRLLNRDWAGARGLLQGMRDARRASG
jgi:glycosyltransferase involved in cell wall biosynthesis